eukprot:CAMPEP_0203953290 /NCGR_PEP_ID=MMETSP0359-20131031/86689_1 /ASSEMBLY_ACC=CAM_ASM_000338 /TAXON_ID=268821 /ORGANISM="Scrippsiella Hangoei, Strain SHTV-5" /LENGTH=138 /DNA_ID=CAMNT_0050886541 /DNA_START=36 /DNA_END=454 /DNA_ORIENTATION=+
MASLPSERARTMVDQATETRRAPIDADPAASPSGSGARRRGVSGPVDHGVCVALSIPGGLRRHRGRVFVLSSGQHVSEEVLRMSERHGYTPPTTRDAEDVDRAAQAWLDHDNAGFAGAVMDDPFDPAFDVLEALQADF